MAIDGFGAQDQRFGDLAIGFGQRQQSEHFKLAGREVRKRGRRGGLRQTHLGGAGQGNLGGLFPGKPVA